MGKVILLEETTKDPISLIGKCAGLCWGADTTDNDKNLKRGKNCLSSGHLRTAEFPQVYMILDGYSARVMREFYTHIGGMPTRLQESTRYVDCSDFQYTSPHFTDNMLGVYDQSMNVIAACYENLLELGVTKEDAANVLPLGMSTKVVVRTNLRNLIDMSHLRLCNRAYWEFRELMRDIMRELSKYSIEWNDVVTEYFKPKCAFYGFCDEEKSCGARPSRARLQELVSKGIEYEQSLDDRK